MSHIGCIGIRHKIPPLPYRGATIVPRPPRAGPPGEHELHRLYRGVPPGGGVGYQSGSWAGGPGIWIIHTGITIRDNC